MRKLFLFACVIPSLASCVVLYTNCSPITIGKKDIAQETNTGNPMESINVTLARFTMSGVSELQVCPTAIAFTSEDVTLPILRIGLNPTQFTFGASDVVLASVSVPRRSFTKIEIEMQRAGGCTESLEVTNANGTFAASGTTTLKFDSPFTVSTETRGLKLGLQPIADALAPATTVSAVDSALVVTSGTAYSQAPIAFVQKQETSVVDTSNTIGISNFNAPLTSGSYVMCAIYFNGGTETVASMGDSLGNTYWRATLAGGVNTLAGWTIETWASPYAIRGGNTNIIATFSNGFTGAKTMSCFEYKGIAIPGTYDNVSSSAGSHPADPWPIAAINYPNELIIAVGGFAGSATVGGLGYSERSNLGNMVVEDKIVSAPGLYPTDFMCAPMDWAMNVLYIRGSL